MDDLRFKYLMDKSINDMTKSELKELLIELQANFKSKYLEE